MRTLIIAAIASVFFACSSTPEDPSALTQPLAQNISISEIAILQALKVPVMLDGDVADRGDIPLVALRDSVLRVYVAPGDGFSPHALVARARITASSPTGASFAQVFASPSTNISGASVENDLTTTLNIPIPGIALERGASVSVVINDVTGDAPDDTQSTARWPQDGTASDLAVQNGGDRVRVMIVPMQYNADGSGRLPDTDDTQIAAYQKHFFQLYPTAEVDITVHDPWAYSGAISANGNGFSQALTALGQLRASDQPDPDVYYYGAFQPTDDFASYCGGGCITGLSPIGSPYSIGIGYLGDATTETAVHEVGHAHGRFHAPCGGAAQPDPNYPYAGASIGVWGYDPYLELMIDPSAYTDMMSYCSPTWISDYHYNLIFTRVRTDNQYFDDWSSGASSRAGTKRFSIASVAETGDVHVSTTAVREPWVTLGQPREVTWDGGKATAYFHPYDHLPGGVLYVPDEVPARARVSAIRDGESQAVIVRDVR
jgi:hypothetical protein